MSRVHETRVNVFNLIDNEPTIVNSDKVLLIRYLQEYHGITLPIEILDENVPAFESITRSRRKYQEVNKVEACDSVEQGRAENEVEHHIYFGGE